MIKDVINERRVQGRFNIVAITDYALDSESAMKSSATSCDLSFAGAKLLVQESLPKGTQLKLVFHLPECKYKFRAKAVIVWQKKYAKRIDGKEYYAIGLNHLAVSESDRQILWNYICQYCQKQLTKFWWKDLN